MKNVLYTALAIAFCLGLGKLVNHFIAGLPASLYGMIFYCLLLQLGWLSPNKVAHANQWIIKHMGICFIPAAVGVINHYELIKHHGFTIVISIVFTTFILLTFVGMVAERYLATSNDKSIEGSN
ncbi:MAG: CidA/LrgA family protein [Colwellia sp.]|nr:CidA/LrgA family protein [Colwellia sp.]MCW8866716.1 CidA/LrgA family protein [Colwellia sp.]MCW9082448.1 CidA/LrgA family protein [Colwellia sp.]